MTPIEKIWHALGLLLNPDGEGWSFEASFVRTPDRGVHVLDRSAKMIDGRVLERGPKPAIVLLERGPFREPVVMLHACRFIELYKRAEYPEDTDGEV